MNRKVMLFCIFSTVFLSFLPHIISADVDPKVFLEVVKGGDLIEVKRLIKEGAGINERDSKGWTALMWAAYHAHMEMVKLFIGRGADANLKGKYGWATALSTAATGGHIQLVKLFIEKGIDINAQTYYGHTNTAELLLHKGANVNTRNSEGNIALDLAARKGHIALVKLLIEKEADVNKKIAL